MKKAEFSNKRNLAKKQRDEKYNAALDEDQKRGTFVLQKMKEMIGLGMDPSFSSFRNTKGWEILRKTLSPENRNALEEAWSIHKTDDS